MPLTPGARLGYYEIGALIGSGGMGEVYEARDSRLNRTIAIKILLDDLSNMPDARLRFEREAQAIAALNHPHIATLHDVGRHERTDFLVMELIEGETLAQRLTRGPLPVDQALQHAIQIGAALDHAHRHGIVHRDLKPANVMLTKSGVKLLDFGLAKLRSSAEGPDWVAATRTGLTGAGTILGSLQYMAPEQVEGRDADARTDVFAFGAVLFEMITGRTAFTGTSQASLIGSILRDTPPRSSTLQPIAPVALDHLIAVCLEKDPDGRWQSARDLSRELKWIADSRARGGDLNVEHTLATAQTRGRIPWTIAAAIALVVASLAGGLAWVIKPGAVAERRPAVRLAVTLPPGDLLAPSQAPSLAISPDGETIVYLTQHGNTRELLVRTLASNQTRALAGTVGANVPFFSPDGQWVAFFAGGKLKKTRLTGTAPQELCDAAVGMGGAWGLDNSIYFVPSNTSGVWKVPAAGGAAQPVTTVDRAKGEVSHRWPQLLPGAEGLLFTVWTGPGADEKHLYLQMLATGERRLLIQGASTGGYVRSGHLVYARDDALMAVPFDLATMQLNGQPVPLEERVPDDEGAQFGVSDTGTLIYLRASARRLERRLVWIDPKAAGDPLRGLDPLPAPNRPYTDPMISPDGRYVAFTNIGPVETIWIHDFLRNTQTALTSTTAGSSQAPVWTADGRRIVYRGSRLGFRNLFWIAVDGSGTEERLAISENLQTPTSWSSDRNHIAFVETAPVSGPDLWVLSLETGKSLPFLKTNAGESAPRFSPDGRLIAYTSTESGRREVYVRPYPGPGGRLQASNDGGIEPVWSHSGEQLFYRHDGEMMSVTMTTTPVLVASSPRRLFAGNYLLSDTGGAGYDVAADGRFLMIQPVEPELPATTIDVVINWFDDLRDRLAVVRR